MYKTSGELKRKIQETEKLQLITNSMNLHSLLRIDKLIKEIRGTAPIMDIIYEVSDNFFGNPKLDFSLNVKCNTDKVLLVVLGSDKGFCGEYNRRLIQIASSYERATTDYIIIGKKITVTDANIIEEIPQLETLSNDFEKLEKFYTNILSLYLSGQYKEVRFIFNKYTTATAYDTVDYCPSFFTGVDSGKADKVYSDFHVEHGDFYAFKEVIMEKLIYIELELAFLNAMATETIQRNIITKGAKDKLEEKMAELKVNKFKLRSEKITSETNDINNSILLKKRSKNEGEN